MYQLKTYKEEHSLYMYIYLCIARLVNARGMGVRTYNIDVHFFATASNIVVDKTFIATSIGEIDNLKHQCRCTQTDAFYTIFIFSQRLIVLLPFKFQGLKISRGSVTARNGDRRLKVKCVSVVIIVRLTAITAFHREASYGKD